MTALVVLERVTFTYAGAVRPALADVSLEIAAGDVMAVTGESGAGTSTLLLVATGFAPRVVGGTLAGTRRIAARRCGVVFARPWTQLTGLCSTVRDEVAFGPASLGLPRAAVLAAARNAMETLHIEQLAGREPSHLSGGELQRVMVAAALAMRPDVLALDDVLPVVAAAGTGVLLATPDSERAGRVATRAVALASGRIVAEGSPAEVLTDTEVARIARAAGCPPPYPWDVPSLLRRVER